MVVAPYDVDTGTATAWKTVTVMLAAAYQLWRGRFSAKSTETAEASSL